MTDDPHAGQPVLQRGARPAEARLAIILVHGRGGAAAEMIDLSGQFFDPAVAYLAPQAAGHTWYPYSFLSPLEQNEPALGSALNVITTLLASLEEQGVGAERAVLLGFSQGACLSLEYAARHPRRYAGIAALSGGLIGAAIDPRTYAGSLVGTPVLLGCSDRDAHVPLARVQESARVLEQLGARVDERIYPGMGHTINDDELRAVRRMMRGDGAVD
ncbi:MAG: dienelactone hydrolase family protein [Acidobacteria bacterium]|nr:dienelactone hydrolase family protein [Acidobacteriota bacterium]